MDWGRDWKLEKLKPLPIIIPKPEQQQSIVSLANRIFSIKKTDSNADTSKLEQEIDKLVYELYGLTEDEVKVVEGGA